jgi:hypothetical protein
MPKIIVHETEKAYLLQQQGIFTISFDDAKYQPNKITLANLLKKNQLDVVNIGVVVPYTKLKVRGRRGNLVKQVRPKKYLVKLKLGQTISNDKPIEI